MARLELVDVGHTYSPDAEDQAWALEPVRLTFEAGRTYAVVGPSGCGKTTMLNVLSGLVTPTVGQVHFDGADVTGRPTRDRNIAQVFQFPVIYRSMTVRENLAFPLQCRGWDRSRIDQRVGAVAEALGLAGRLDDRARRLTADDKQLISLGRGLVRDDVAALLMDEPLTVIDPQLKSSLRRRIRELSEQFRPTVVYVTHDQYEAMTFAQELIVMRDGRVMQQGSPEELFECPRSTYVGWFIGSPAMNYLDVEWSGSVARIGGAELRAAWTPARSTTGRTQIGIRPEYLRVVSAPGPNRVVATMVSVRDLGPTRVIHIEVEGQPATVALPRNRGVPAGETVVVELPRAKVLPYLDGELAGAD